MKYYAIIVGGGAGARMQQNIPKQFLLLDHKPVLMHTISAFYQSAENPEIILVLNNLQISNWEQLCITHNFNLPHRIVEGGEERFHSVRNGLMSIKGDGLVAVHDAVRPLISSKLINSCYQKAMISGNAIPSITPRDSIRRIKLQTSKILNREEIVLIQTPQTFQLSQLRKAYQQPYKKSFTDDASVVQKAGFNINLIEGERTNFKITFPEDLELAHFFVHKKNSTEN